MKNFLLLLALSVSVTAFAQKKVEFDETQEKSCHSEAKKIGCAKDEDAVNTACAKTNKSKISTKCHQILGIQ